MFVIWKTLNILDHYFFYIYTSSFDLQIVVENLSMKQTEVEVELRGPPVAKAFDEEGNPTKVGYPQETWLYSAVVILLILVSLL
jgi:glycyl-tRNA synthetase beta subunit